MRRWPGPALWGVALAVGAFELIGSFGAAARQPERRDMDVLAVILVLVGPASLAVRDRWPLAAVAVSITSVTIYIGLGYPYGPIFASVVVALVTAILAGRRRATWLLAAGGLAGYVVAASLDPYGNEDVLLHATLVAGWLVVVLAIAEVVRGRRDAVLERRRAEREARQRREGEQRLALAQELHDVLAHHISLINVQAGVALHLIDDQPERVRPALADIKVASREALRELRGALDILRRGEDAPRAPAPRLDDLDRLVAAVGASGLDVRLDDDGTRPPELPAAVELAVYRIVQEALTNVSRHATATTALVRLRYDADVTVEVIDDGVGGTPVPGNGIAGMRERASALGGNVEVGPGPGGGFRVVARVPIGVP